VRALKGHKDEVTAVRYTVDELYLVSAGADMEILIWDLTSCEVIRRLQGHSDIITSIAISSDCSLMVSSSMDMYLKTWFLTPRIPDAPDSPIFLSKTDTTVMIKWSSPPAFNLEISAYQLQYRVGLRGPWLPDANTPPKTIPPWSRSIIIPNLEPSQAYQFRLKAENEMGSSKWGGVSKLICTDLGLPTCLERPTACKASMTSITVFWFTPNPAVFTGASTLFHMNYSGNTKSYEQHTTHEMSLEACLVEGSVLLERFRTILLDYNLSMIERQHRKAELLNTNDSSVRTAENQNGHADIDSSDSEADDDIFPIRSAVSATVSPPHNPTSDNPSPSVDSTANPSRESSGQSPRNELVLVKDQVDDKGGQSECKLHPLAIEKVMSRLSDENAIFVAYTTTNLAIGCPYRFQVRAVNRLGEGPLSPESYSFSTTSAPPRYVYIYKWTYTYTYI
jgi:WD40 repeat protein